MERRAIHELAIADQAIVAACRSIAMQLGQEPKELEAIADAFRACICVLTAVVMTDWQQPSNN